jgi:hypothetical protein
MAVLTDSGWRAVGRVFMPAIGLYAAAVLSACGQNTEIPPQHERFGFHSVESFDVVADDDRLHLLLTVRKAKEAPVQLVYTESFDAGRSWHAPSRVETGNDPSHKPHGRDIKLAVKGNHRVALWNTAGSGFMGNGPMTSALSADGGKTWVPGPNPADDGSDAGHGFYDLAADDGGALHLAWLDNRAGQQGLIYARSDDRGRSWSENVVVDAATCQCCWNTLLPLKNGALRLLYRDDDPRDMRLASSPDAGKTWRKETTVGKFNWSFDGCPHVGGALAHTQQDGQERLHALVWTGREGREGLYVLNSEHDGSTWSPPQRLGGDRGTHGDMAASGKNLLAVWDAATAQGFEITASRSDDEGQSWLSAQRLYAGVHPASHPKVVATKQGFAVFWTERSADGGKTLVLRPTDLPQQHFRFWPSRRPASPAARG